jgi:hypothetical protein
MNLSVIHTYAEDFNQYENLYDSFLKKIEDGDSPAIVNMGHDAPAGLAYLVKNNVRWTKSLGEIALLHNDDTGMIVGVSGVEHSTLSGKLGSGGNRCWLLPEYRSHNEVTKYLLSANLKWCISNNKYGMLLTFNDYNKWIYNTIAKLSTGRGAALGNVWSNWWDDCIVLPRKITLFNTPQWAVVKSISSKEEVDLVIADIDNKFGISNDS